MAWEDIPEPEEKDEEGWCLPEDEQNGPTDEEIEDELIEQEIENDAMR